MDDCPYIARINAYHDGELIADERTVIQSHLALGCAVCSKELKSLQRVSVQFREIEGAPEIQSSFVSKLHRQVDSLTDRSILHFAELLTGVAAALLVTASMWAMRTPSASADPMRDWERAAVTLRPEMIAAQQPASLHAAEWIVNDLANGEGRHE
jgi:hypothetical protein